MIASSMPRIAEIYCEGTLNNQNLIGLVKSQHCRIRDAKCDGGGNRYSSNIDVPSSQFSGIVTEREICSSVCSINVTEEKNWIVCPRRLFYLGGVSGKNDPQNSLKNFVKNKSGLAGQVAWWKEVKFKSFDNRGNSFDYTFDYVLASYDIKNSCVLSPPIIVEVMTSSTSGGNKKKGTTIPQSFQNLVISGQHSAPGINYRQVWGRMISQFFVKSQVAANWGGKTFWIIQDSLLDYIQNSTAFDFNKLRSIDANEINLISVGFSKDNHGNPYLIPQKIDMASGVLSAALGSGFMSILGTPFIPDIEDFNAQLESRAPDGMI